MNASGMRKPMSLMRITRIGTREGQLGRRPAQRRARTYSGLRPASLATCYQRMLSLRMKRAKSSPEVGCFSTASTRSRSLTDR